MQTAAIIFILILAVVLILVVLVQNPKGGLSSQFTGGSSQVMGVQNTNKLLEKITWGLAVGIIVLSLSANSFFADSFAEDETEYVEDANIEAAKNKVGGFAPAAEEATEAIDTAK